MLHTLRPAHGSTKKRKRVARGNSGKGGTTAGKGTKGQQARSGKSKLKPGFEGGQVPLLMRQPKLGGFKRARKQMYEALTLSIIEAALEPGTYDIAALRQKKLVRTKNPVKLLGNTALTKKFDLTLNATSKAAVAAVKKAGGSVTIVQ